MQLTSLIFLGLVAFIYLVIYVLNRATKDADKSNRLANWIILVASYIFVLYADYKFAIVLFVLTLSTWFFAKKEKLYYLGIIVALLSLAFFKYTNFFIDSFSRIFKLDSVTLNIILPIGISFYTFSAISYLVDVKRKKIISRGFKEVALYLSFFPKLTSGPIQRSGDFFEQAEAPRKIGFDTFSVGIQIFVFGLFKKIVIADRLSVFVDQVFDTPLAFGSFTVFLSVIAYAIQIYFDFSGYSDMAIGIAKLFGFNLPRNFNLPYLAHNVTELWKRWHITLSSWLQDYLYIPLGGSRKGKILTYVNLILTMVIGGLWHGANWTFIIWGALHGFALAIHKIWMKISKSPEKKHSVFSNIISIFVTFLFTSFCWIFFRANSVSDSFIIIKRIFSFEGGLEQPYLWLFFAIGILLASSLVAVFYSKKKGLVARKNNNSFVEAFYPNLDLRKFWHLVLFFVVCGLILCLAYTGGSPFIYGKF